MLKLASSAKISRISTLTYSKLKVGDRFIATGQTDATGAFTATGVAINMEMNNGGPGGPGGPGGFPGGGPGGPGGPGGEGPVGDGNGPPPPNL